MRETILHIFKIIIKLWKKYISVRILGYAILLLMITLLPPVIINNSYFKGKSDHILPNTFYSASDLLFYYGSVLTFLGTGFLGLAALRQNQRLHEKNLKLEEEKYFAENLVKIYPIEKSEFLNWRSGPVINITKSVDKNITLLDKNLNPSHNKLLLSGDLKLKAHPCEMIKCKINNAKLIITAPHITPSQFICISDDEYKMVESNSMDSIRFFLSIYLDCDDILNDAVYEKLTRYNCFEFILSFDIFLKNKNIVTESFVVLNLKYHSNSPSTLETHMVRDMQVINKKSYKV
jgi:hypothetical protein